MLLECQGLLTICWQFAVKLYARRSLDFYRQFDVKHISKLCSLFAAHLLSDFANKLCSVFAVNLLSKFIIATLVRKLWSFWWQEFVASLWQNLFEQTWLTGYICIVMNNHEIVFKLYIWHGRHIYIFLLSTCFDMRATKKQKDVIWF